MREHFGYVMQDDSHLVELTVRETLTYSALLRLPANLTYNEKLARVEEVLSDLGLRNVANTKVGGGYVRGVSGGERRRVSIGVQLLKDPCNPPPPSFHLPVQPFQSSFSSLSSSNLAAR